MTQSKLSVCPTIKKRHSYRQFIDKKVIQAQLDTILKAAMYSPSARHTCAWEFIQVTDSDVLNQLSKFKPQADFIAQAPVAIIICSQDFDYWLEDASIAAAMIYLQTTYLGLGTCWVNVSKKGTGQENQQKNDMRADDSFEIADKDQIQTQLEKQVKLKAADYDTDQAHYLRKLLHIPNDIFINCVMPIGYVKKFRNEHAEAEYKQNKVHLNAW